MQLPQVSLFRVSILLTLVVLQASPAAAITVSATTFEGTTYNLIRDDSGHEWLSLLATDGLTYAFVSSQIDNAIGDYADYRFATRDEVAALFVDYGAPDIDVGATGANFPIATALEADFGSTGAISVGEPLSWGYTSTILVQGSNTFPNFHLSPLVRLQTAGGEARFATTLAVDVVSDPNPHLRGSWLIRTTAASPQTVPSLSVPFALLLAGMLVLIGGFLVRRRSMRPQQS